MPLPSGFLNKSEAQIRHDLAGLPDPVLEATLRLRDSGDFREVQAMLPGLITYHLPPGTASPPDPLPLEYRLGENLGLDSLALSEMAFKLDEVFCVPIETHEVAHVQTVQDLQDFLREKLGLQSPGDDLSAQLPVTS
jgi:acyl carrier protein